MPSTITTPVSARLRPSDREALQSLAYRHQTTVSALIARLVSDALPQLDAS
jgi:hypothetical protein